MKGIRRLLPLIMAVALAMLPMLSAQAAPSNAALNNSEIESLLRKNSSEQSSYFTSIVNERLKYVTTRSFAGKDGKWIGFVDLYSQYKDGNPTGYILERAIVRYGNAALPRDTESCTLRIGDRTSTMQYSSRESMGFTFATNPPVSLGSSAATATPTFSVRTGSGDVDVSLKQAFPGSGIPSMHSALGSMAPAYVNYVESNNSNGGFDHCVMRLRSYISDSTSLARNYTWELSLIHGASLPCKATIVRYDCKTEKINISQRELRSYFSS